MRIFNVILDKFPQDHYLISPRTTGHVHVQRHVGTSSFEEFFSSKPEAWLWNSFARPVSGAKYSQTYHRPCSTKPAKIETLPTELLDLIIDYVWEKKEDVLAFGIASARVWPVVLDRVHRDYKSGAATWASKRVSFHGARSHQSPCGFFEHGLDDIISELDGIEEAYFGLIKSAYEGQDLKNDTPLDSKWMDVLASKRVLDWGKMSENIRIDLQSAYMFPQDRIWVLRNLRSQEFIRSDRLRPNPLATADITQSAIKTWICFLSPVALLSPQSGLQDNAQPVSFGQLLLVLTSFSNKIPRFGITLQSQNGPWAGDYFDIVPLDSHLHETQDSKPEWRDVSEGAVNDVSNLRYWAKKLVAWENEGVPKTSSARIMKIAHERMKWHNW
ncbi:hypothetical protein B0J11DRAFT_516177 [Dendryphion nanum]|uniref:Uncharacterized protein n=1 Tax=Dendryphion nanum TaxID=256645 RepID=A0A9P9EGJ9_9PLEO|nr:hypothetical protein B0J11DRAFT_516177 [Dendryphion nanum]